jgi:hypothetical protein
LDTLDKNQSDIPVFAQTLGRPNICITAGSGEREDEDNSPLLDEGVLEMPNKKGNNFPVPTPPSAPSMKKNRF